MTPDGFQYVGNELELFARARNWKAYLASQIRPYLGHDVLEVGAGLGATSQMLCTPSQHSWTALEPDPRLASKARASTSQMPVPYEVRTGTSSSLSPQESFDSVLYIDVLEHIADDATEVRTSTRHLRPGGYLVVLSPAHQWLFSPFDAAIGHCRRYSGSTLRSAVTAPLRLVRRRYLDCVGVMASLVNKALLRQAAPTIRQIEIWDRVMVPISRRLDSALAFRVGKSILGVWQAQ
jgi:SAM-dependent methyltransferase